MEDAERRRGAVGPIARILRPPIRSSLRSARSGGYFAWVDERHHAPQCAADLFDLMLAVCRTHPGEVRPAGMVFLDPFLGERAAADVVEQFAHGGAGVVGDDAASGDIIAPFCRIADRVAHVVEAALIEQVDDQLQFVHTLEVRDLGLIASLDQRVEARLDQFRHTTAQHGLFAEQVGFGFLGEGGFQHARAGRCPIPWHRPGRWQTHRPTHPGGRRPAPEYHRRG